jgi:hypothetical protein
MKFKKFGKALLMSALSAGVVLSVTSCVQDYSVGYLFVTGTETAGTNGAGIITGYKIDHNTGKLSAINGLPVSSGGANPVRAVLVSGSHFLYVLNRGTTASGGSNCTTADPCLPGTSNITVFAVGANGILTPQETFYSQGINPFRLIADSAGSHIFVLDHDAPDSASYTGKVPASTSPNSCMQVLGGATSCGDITVFSINATTGRLSLVTNTPSTGTTLSYFPVPTNPVDFALASTSNSILTLSAAGSTVQSFPYAGGSLVFPYSYNSSTGQLAVSQNSAQTLTDGSTASQSQSGVAGVPAGTAIDFAGGNVYVLDNNPITVTTNGTAITSPSQILPYSVGTNGALQTQTGGAFAESPSVSNPVVLIVESKGRWVYIANQGNNTDTTNAQSGVDAFLLTSPFNLAELGTAPFGVGGGPQCLVEDPTNQFIYTANFNGSTVTGRAISQQDGTLVTLTSGPANYLLSGPPTWCLVDGRTD